MDKRKYKSYSMKKNRKGSKSCWSMNARPKSWGGEAATVAVDNIRVKPITPQEAPDFDSSVIAGIQIER